MRSVTYAVEEALISLRRAGQSAAMSVGTIAIAFLTLAGFLLVSANLQAVVSRWASAAELSIYLREDAGEETRQALVTETEARPGVRSVEWVSKETALQRFKEEFPELADVTATDQNPFPGSIEVRLQPDPASARVAETLASELVSRAGVADVRYDGKWLTRVTTAVTAVHLGGLAIAGVLILGAAFTVASVVRLSLAARHDEIDIMQLVGAPAGFIRGPFIAEGTLLGGVGAGIAVLVLWGAFSWFRLRIDTTAAALVSTGATRFLGWVEVALVLGAGCTVGALAGVIASRSAR